MPPGSRPGSWIPVLALATIIAMTCPGAATHASGSGPKGKAGAEIGERSEGPMRVAKIAFGLTAAALSGFTVQEEATAQVKAANAQAEAVQTQAAKAQMGAAQTQFRV